MIPFNQIVGIPSLADLLDLFKKDVFLTLNCHAIATVKEFDSEGAPSVLAEINYTQSFFLRNPDGTYSQQERNYPPIQCPAIILGGGGGHLTFPISSGDQALILFNDRDMSNWIAGNTTGPVASPALHAFTDAIALVGLNQRPIADYDPDRAVLRYGDTIIGAGATKVLISNGTTLNTLLGNLITAIKGITTTNCVVGSPVVLNPASIAALTLAASALGDLLE